MQFFESKRPRIEHTGGRLRLQSGASAVALMGLLSAVPAARAAVIHVVDVIPNAASAETGQNSEPSLAVDPLDPTQMISGSFSSTFTGNQVVSPFWKSTNGGTTWSGFGNLTSVDKSLAWRQDGVAALAVTQTLNNGFTQPSSFNTFQSGGTNFGAAINVFNPGQSLDQPWIRTGPSGQTYETYNNLSNGAGRTASIRASADNGVNFAPQVTLETVNPAGGQDAPSVRQAVNGSTVYAAFTRWGGLIENDANGLRFGNSQVVVVKSTNSGASFSAGVSAATTTGFFANTANTPLTLGQERTSSDVAIAVDPNNANHVVVAYGDAPGANGSGLLQLHVTESTDGGATWTNKFTTAANVRSALPAVSILVDGGIGLLYASYNPATNQLSEHFLTTTDDFATTDDSLLGTESNAFPLRDFEPYLGDFFDLTSVGDTFYGIFSASNADNGTNALFADVAYQRNFVGTPGTPGFGLRDLSGNPVNFSIDPYVFSFSVPEPATLTLLGAALLGLAALRRRRSS
jgi:hypothetical protein